MLVLFFFSSRRRHTRFDCDWSSDVCSSDLEPVERLTIDIPEDFLGVTTQLLAVRKGRLEQIVNHGTGWVRMDYLVPARGLVGFRSEFLMETRGEGMLHQVFELYEPWHGPLRTRRNGTLVADRRGRTAE